jgi:hypothetical protein
VLPILLQADAINAAEQFAANPEVRLEVVVALIALLVALAALFSVRGRNTKDKQDADNRRAEIDGNATAIKTLADAVRDGSNQAREEIQTYLNIIKASTEAERQTQIVIASLPNMLQPKLDLTEANIRAQITSSSKQTAQEIITALLPYLEQLNKLREDNQAATKDTLKKLDEINGGITRAIQDALRRTDELPKPVTTPKDNSSLIVLEPATDKTEG